MVQDVSTEAGGDVESRTLGVHLPLRITVGSHVHGRYPPRKGPGVDAQGSPCNVPFEWCRATVVALLDATEHHEGALGNGGPGYRLKWTGVAEDDPLYEIRDLAAENVREATDANDAYIRLNHGPGSATCLGRRFPVARELLARGTGTAQDELSQRAWSREACLLAFGLTWALQVYIAFHISTAGDLMRDLIYGVNSTEPIQGIEIVNGTVTDVPRFETLLPGIFGFPFLVAIVTMAFRILGLACGIDCGGPGVRSVIWAIFSLLTVVPACLFASSHAIVQAKNVPRYGALGVVIFVFALWSLGWVFLWFRAPRIQPIQDNQRLLAMPPGMGLKLFAVMSECFNYCGFSFFPALPWRAMEVPPSVPNPQVGSWLERSTRRTNYILTRRILNRS